jgi:hypothetical protein
MESVGCPLLWVGLAIGSTGILRYDDAAQSFG